MNRSRILETYLALKAEANKAVKAINLARTDSARLLCIEHADIKVQAADDYYLTYDIKDSEINT